MDCPVFAAAASRIDAAAHNKRALELAAQSLTGVLPRRDWINLEFGEIAPLGHPALEQRDVVGFHELKTAGHIGCYPAAYEFQAVGHHPAFLTEAAIDRLPVPVAKIFDDHEVHAAYSD